MPVEVTYYRCQFRCGTKAKSTLQIADHHEAVCFKNPARKACTTCKHEVYVKDTVGDEYGSRASMYRGCKRLTEEQFQEAIQKCEYHSTPVFHIQPVVKCDLWEPK